MDFGELEDQKIVRDTLMRELETINHYQELMAATSGAVRDLLAHLLYEEKEHVAELTELLKRLDPDQLKQFSSTHAREIAPGQSTPQNASFSLSLTVGSLLGNPQ